MANRYTYTHDELISRLKSSGWKLVTGQKDKSISIKGTLEQLIRITHARHEDGQAPDFIEEVETLIELEMIEIEKLWRDLGLPV